MNFCSAGVRNSCRRIASHRAFAKPTRAAPSRCMMEKQTVRFKHGRGRKEWNYFVPSAPSELSSMRSAGIVQRDAATTTTAIEREQTASDYPNDISQSMEPVASQSGKFQSSV